MTDERMRKVMELQQVLGCLERATRTAESAQKAVMAFEAKRDRLRADIHRLSEGEHGAA